MALVQQFGSASFQKREKASKDLLHLGRSAYPALLSGSSDANTEVRFRCRQLLPQIYELELKARLDAFLADVEGKKEHDLPGLTRFRKSFGFDNRARELYVSMLRAA